MKTSSCKLVCVLIVLFAAAVHGQKMERNDRKFLSGAEQKANLKKFVENLRPAFLNRDYEKLAIETYNAKEFESQESIDDEDKKEKAIAVIKQLFEDTAAEGMTFSTRLRSPQKIVAAGGRLFAVVPQDTIITVSKNNRLKDANGSSVEPGNYNAKGFILAISRDGGKS